MRGCEIMTLRNLQIFVAVADCLNMTMAAKKLYISQPSVSMAVSEIEKEYGVALFERISGKLKLTPMGKTLRSYAQNVLEMIEKMESLTREEASACIKIGATVTIGSTIMGPIIAKMKESMPKVDYHVTVANTRIIEKMLMNSEVDIAFVEGQVSNPNLEVYEVLSDELIAISGPEHCCRDKDSVTLKELSKEPLILREPESGTRAFFEEAMQKAGLNYTVRWTSYSYGAIIQAVKNNLGVGIMSRKLVEKYIEDGSLCGYRIKDANLSRSFRLLYVKNKYITDMMLKFSEIVGNLAAIEMNK